MVPILLLFLTVGTYGPLIPFLGFYWDDWPVINLIQNQSDFWAFYAYDRPVSAWTMVLTGPLLGVSPLKWHLFTLIMRWLTTLGVWWVLMLTWPALSTRVTWITVLFAVHPAFTLQPISVAFSQHWITWALFAFSLGAMLAAVRYPRQFIIFTGLALTTQLLHALTMEYFWGLELIRPGLLWIVFGQRESGRERLIKTAKHTLPYFGVLAGLVIWRAYFLEIPGGDPNALLLIDTIRQNPIAGIQHGLNIAVSDFVHLLLNSWSSAFRMHTLDISDRFNLFSWGWGFFIGLLVAFFLWQQAKHHYIDVEQTNFHQQAIPLGLIAILLAMLPTWFTDNQITVGLFSSRFALPALFGTGILMVGLLDYFLREAQHRVIFTAVLVALSVGIHLQNTNDFRWDWIKQQRFFWQLAWRIPGLENRTALFSDGAIFQYAGSYSTSSALNTLYPLQVSYPEQSYWFVELDRTFLRDMEAFIEGAEVTENLRNLTFTSTSHDGVVIFYEPDVSSCLWVLEPRDNLNADLPTLTAEAALVSNLDRIQAERTYSMETFEAIFDPEPEPDWCYFYQKASLASQIRNWEATIQLEQAAVEMELQPSNVFEWFPFIEARARLGHWEAAEELILFAYQDSKQTRDRPAFCAFWQSLAPEQVDNQVEKELECSLLIE